MTLMQIITLVVAIVVYIIVVFYLTYKFGDNAPFWFQFVAFPVDVVGFILLFPIAIYQKYKMNQDYKSSIQKIANDIKNQ